jgi:hypothetical protein
MQVREGRGGHAGVSAVHTLRAGTTPLRPLAPLGHEPNGVSAALYFTDALATRVGLGEVEI